MKTDLLKEAIADADAIKKLAIENAKASLNQAFDSKIKSMLAARLQEEAEGSEKSDSMKDENYMEESSSSSSSSKKHLKGEAKGKKAHKGEESSSSSSKSSSTKSKEGEEGTMDEVDIDKILAEMEEEESTSKSTKMKEEKDYYDTKHGAGPNLDEESSSSSSSSMKEEKDYYDVKKGGKLKEMEESSSSSSSTSMKEAKKKHHKGEESSKSSSSSKSEEGDEELDLNALLRELEEGSYDEASKSGSSKSSSSSKSKMAENIEGSESEQDKDEKSYSKFEKKKHADVGHKQKTHATRTEKMYEAEIREIKKQAERLAQKVNETNLINAKLLYLNKILNKHNLNESQKVKVIAAFDRAASVKEAKIVFESLNGALVVKTQGSKTSLKESLGFASKAAGNSTKRQIIAEADVQVARWQKLAGINQQNKTN